MGEFNQTEMITTLRKYSGPLHELEEELYEYSRDTKVALMLPAGYFEFDDPKEEKAIYKIIHELKGVPYINEVVMPLGKASKNDFKHVKEAISALETSDMDVDVIWINGEGVQKVKKNIEDKVGSTGEGNKGFAMFLATGHILGKGESDVIIYHDCDIVHYDRSIPANLVHPLIHPDLDYDWEKAYYDRVTDRFFGRANRLFADVIAYVLLDRIRSDPQSSPKAYKFLKSWSELKYKFSGEGASKRGFALEKRWSDGYDIETLDAWEAIYKVGPNRICQKEITDNFEHRHQDIHGKDREYGGLQKMVTDVSCTLFHLLRSDGMDLNIPELNTIITMYKRKCEDFIRKYRSDSISRGLMHDSQAEEVAMQTFYDALGKTIEKSFDENGRYKPPKSIKITPNWERIHSTIPSIYDNLIDAVRADKRI